MDKAPNGARGPVRAVRNDGGWSPYDRVAEVMYGVCMWRGKAGPQVAQGECGRGHELSGVGGRSHSGLLFTPFSFPSPTFFAHLTSFLLHHASFLLPLFLPFSKGALGGMPDGDTVESLQLPTVHRDEVQGGQSRTSTGSNEVTPPVSVEMVNEAIKGMQEKERVAKKKEEPQKPFLLSEGLPPVPAKLVTRIQKGEFIDMAELLQDNLEAQRRGALQESGSASASPSQSRPRREIPDLLSWVQCFGMYTAVMASKYPERVHKLLAYQTLIVREARRCGGRGWLSYDTVFRQQMVGEWREEEWGRLNPYLFSSTFLALGTGNRSSCSLCLESDHKEEDCALAKGKGALPPKQPASREPYYRESTIRQSKGKLPCSMACFAWNQGECTFQFCKFRHTCVRCGGDHRIIHCRSLSITEKKVPREREGKGRGDGADH